MPTKIVGVIELASKYKYGFTSRGVPLYLFTPYDAAAPPYIVGSSSKEIHYNQIALIEVVSQCDPPRVPKGKGNLIKLFGRVGDPVAEREALLIHYCPPVPKGIALTLNLDLGQGSQGKEERQELSAETGWITFHIDPPGCRDIDDAVAFNPTTKTWAITIADAAAAVPVGSAIDLDAQATGSTFYDLDGHAVRSMLPAAISQGSASLLPGERRKGLTLFLDSGQFAQTWITVDHSFTYDSFTGSAVAFDLDISREPHAWIEELMIRYNRAAAAVLKGAGQGLLRVQPIDPVDPVIAAIDPSLSAKGASYVPALGLESGSSQGSQGSQGNQIHASLGLYCHASSPLRRYADLVNQRVLKAIINGKGSQGSQGSQNPSIMADHLNLRAKASKRWQRDLTFMTHVTAGKVHEVGAVWISDTKVWVPEWKRKLQLRHEEVHEIGYHGLIKIYCDPTRRNWKQRILTAPINNT